MLLSCLHNNTHKGADGTSTVTIHNYAYEVYGSKTASQQCRYYEVDNIFEYMVNTYINGNITSFKDIYRELNKDARRDFVDFIFNEVNPKYTIELIKKTI